MKVLLFANTDWYLYNFRLPLAEAIRGISIEVVLVSPPGEYSQRLLAEGFRWIPLIMDRRSLNPLSELRVIMNLIRIYQQEKPDLVHHFTVKSVLYGSFAARIARIQNTVNAVTGLGHVFTSKGMLARVLRPVVKFSLRNLMKGDHNRLILQNPDDYKDFLEEKLIDQENIRLILSSGVNIKRFSPKPGMQAKEKLNILLATRLLWDKGIQEYVDAARIVLSSGYVVDFLLAGVPDRGNPSAVSNADLKKWSNDGIVRHIGHIEDMPDLLKTMDIVVLPSYREGVPRILLEAAATGLPIVTTDVPGCREIVTHGVNGFLVQAKGAEQLAQTISILIESPEVRKAMGEAGRKIVIEKFDEQVVIKKTLDVYRELIPILSNDS